MKVLYFILSACFGFLGCYDFCPRTIRDVREIGEGCPCLWKGLIFNRLYLWFFENQSLSDADRNVRCNQVGLQSIPAFNNRTEFAARIAFFADNEITELQEGGFSYGYSTLETLHLQNNNLTKILPGTFLPLLELEKLFLQNNFIEKIDDFYFSDLAQLKFLFLENNRIQTVSKSAFVTQRNLEILDLSRNSILHLHGLDMSGLISLRFLNLRSNNLSSIGIQRLPESISLELISLDDNNWSCDERTSCFTREPLLEIIRNSSALLTAPLICEEPRKYRGRNLFQVLNDIDCSKVELFPTISSAKSKFDHQNIALLAFLFVLLVGAQE